jgi:polyhydroxyalkanoate synthesis regulator phasin
MSEQLQQIAACDQPWAAARAQYALQIINAVNAGEMSPDEGRELMKDLVSTDKLNAESDDMQLKAALVSAVYLAANIPL